MFSQASVCLSPPQADTPCPVHAGIHTPCPVHAGIHPLCSACWDIVNKWAVRISTGMHSCLHILSFEIKIKCVKFHSTSISFWKCSVLHYWILCGLKAEMLEFSRCRIWTDFWADKIRRVMDKKKTFKNSISCFLMFHEALFTLTYCCTFSTDSNHGSDLKVNVYMYTNFVNPNNTKKNQNKNFHYSTVKKTVKNRAQTLNAAILVLSMIELQHWCQLNEVDL